MPTDRALCVHPARQLRQHGPRRALHSGGSLDAGHCAFVCSGPECSTPANGDHPGSKWFQTRQALHQVVSGIDDVQFGFATFNQDRLRVNTKHWLYEAATAGPDIPGWGPWPAAGAQEVFGKTWIPGGDGGSVAYPADLTDTWEATRMKRVPKGGETLAQTVDVFLRHFGKVYRVRYQPTGGVFGGPLQTQVTTVRCNDASCANQTAIGSAAISWNVAGDFLYWEGASSRTNPMSYFGAAADATAANSCTAGFNPPGWDSNTDISVDPWVDNTVNYNLRWPTDASDPRGEPFTFGDVIPWDWTDDHRDDLLARLAPNQAVDPLAAPDFRTAAYLENSRFGSESVLRLRDEVQRPLFTTLAETPFGAALDKLYSWYTGLCRIQPCPTLAWEQVAAAEDPEWLCRRKYVLVITDDFNDTCGGGSQACAVAANLKSRANIRSSVITVGRTSPVTGTASCIAYNGKGLKESTNTRQQMVDALTNFLFEVRLP